MRSFTGGLMLIAVALMFVLGDPSWAATFFLAFVACVGVVLIVDDL